MSRYETKPFRTGRIHTTPLGKRQSKVSVRDFGRAPSGSQEMAGFVDCLPDILAGKQFKELIRSICRAKKRNKPILFACGAHVIKVGLSPVLIDLMKNGWVTAAVLNGAGIIHDFEVAFAGHTSEDVSVQLKDGRFGMAQETGDFLNQVINAAGMDVGLGEAVSKAIFESDPPFKDQSLLAAAYERNIPVTVHVGIGTDTIHMHPEAEGAAVGRLSLRDFLLLCSLVKNLDDGGVFLNIGSAVLLPEVFLKAVSLIRNQGNRCQGFTTAVFDFNQHYRPFQNVVKRPPGEKGRGFYFVGHHEIMIPLLAAALKSS